MNKGNSSHTGIFILKLVARFHFRALYFLSDMFFLLIYHVVRYRKKVVMENLQNSFPEKKEKELKQIARKFYRHFADLTLETIKLASIGETELKKRMTVKNPELINRYFEQKKSVVVLTMHYNNWEWGSAFPLFLRHKILGVYKPLHNLRFDHYMNRNRARFGAEMVSNSLILRRVIKAHNERQPVFIWLAGDQTPPWFHKFWLMFMNQETMFYPGPAAISRRFNYPVIFQKTVKKKRGFYETTFEVLFENPEQFSETEIMKTYIRKMEETISEKPAYYLWSHKRWKNKRPENVPMKN
jgi:Kdo2-lipid IVA lauroyltransferase/acyltransferase